MNLYAENDYYEVLAADNHDDWLKLRQSGIGGSEVASILGLNPYMNNQELWSYKVGLAQREDISDKPYVKYGHDAEPHLRNLFALDYPRFDVQYVDNVVLSNRTYPFIRYSPDGLIFDKKTGLKGIFECKTTNILQSMAKEKWNHKVPDNYYCQILQGLLVTGFDFVVLRAQLNYNNAKMDFQTLDNEKGGYKQIRDYVFYRSDRQVSDDIQLLLNKEYVFYTHNVMKMIEPSLILPRPKHELS